MTRRGWGKICVGVVTGGFDTGDDPESTPLMDSVEIIDWGPDGNGFDNTADATSAIEKYALEHYKNDSESEAPDYVILRFVKLIKVTPVVKTEVLLREVSSQEE
jgi:hypothetical protein